MTIKTHPYHTKEIQYTIKTLFQVFLGLEYSIEYENTCNGLHIRLKNGNFLFIEDHFFYQLKEKMYLKKAHIPQHIPFKKIPFAPEKDIPAIYGTPECYVKEEKGIKSIHCKLDIISSTFFMLSRWEEYVNTVRDQYDRFPAKASLAYKQGFLHRPVVNEYIELVWNMLSFLGIKQERKKHEFKIIPTHDIDFLTYPKKKWIHLIHSKFIKHEKNALQKYHKNIQKDPYDIYEYLMDLSEAMNTKSHFYFMGGRYSKYDTQSYLHKKRFYDLISQIKSRGHIIGFHGSYNSSTNTQLFGKEKDKLEEIIHVPLNEGRQHYLRFRNPDTWSIWEDNNMHIDSTLGYADQVGFRCGICYDYPVFHIIEQKTLHLYERPLIIMEVTLVNYQKQTVDQALKTLLEYKKKIARYNGNFVLLWHNSSFNVDHWPPYKEVYEKTLYLKT